MLPVILLALAAAVAAASLVFDGIDRKIRARLQARVGPPLLQPFYDIIKLLRKSWIAPRSSAKGLFTALPPLALAFSTLAGAVTLAAAAGLLELPGDVVIVYSLLTASSLSLLLGGASSGNPYASISLSRGVSTLFAFKLPLLVAVLAASMRGGAWFSIARALEVQRVKGPTLLTISGATALLAILAGMPAEGEVTPFDVTTAETEIVSGFMVEYSGPLLAFAKLSKSVSRFTTALLASILTLCFPLGNPWAEVAVCFLGALLIMFLSITLTATFVARVRVDQLARFFWRIPLLLSLISLAAGLSGW
ncbi:MAG: complex I subunit 1 family protein [Thermofilaceae archaeon]